MSPNFIGPDMDKKGKLAKDKNLMKKNKENNQKWIMLNNLEHLLPPSKIRMA